MRQRLASVLYSSKLNPYIFRSKFFSFFFPFLNKQKQRMLDFEQHWARVINRISPSSSKMFTEIVWKVYQTERNIEWISHSGHHFSIPTTRETKVVTRQSESPQSVSGTSFAPNPSHHQCKVYRRAVSSCLTAQ